MKRGMFWDTYVVLLLSFVNSVLTSHIGTAEKKKYQQILRRGKSFVETRGQPQHSKLTTKVSINATAEEEVSRQTSELEQKGGP